MAGGMTSFFASERGSPMPLEMDMFLHSFDSRVWRAGAKQPRMRKMREKYWT